VAEEDKAAARALAAAAAERFANNEWTTAADAYEQALARWDHPALHFSLLVVLIRLKRYVEAWPHLVAAGGFEGQALSADQRTQLETYRGLLADSTATLVVVTVQGGVAVSLDGEPLLQGAGRAERVLLPGSHALVATKPGHETMTRNLTLFGGQALLEELVLVPRKQEFELVRRWPRRLPWTVAIAGGGAMAVGALALWRADANFDAFDVRIREASEASGNDAVIPTPEVLALRDRGDAYNVAGGALLGLGAAAAVAGAVLLYVNQPRRVEVMPVAAPVGDGAVLGLGGRF
jgi:hypothetical protein